MDPATAAMIASAIAALGSTAAGALSASGSGKESKLQRKQRKTIDEILASLRGEGEFSNLFATDEEAFQKSFVDPAKQKFKTQIAPTIQQQFISSGLQRGTGLDDSLTRAGVDLDTLLNQQFLDFQQGGQNRMMEALRMILSGGAGAAPGTSFGEGAAQGAGGFLSSREFGQGVESILNKFTQDPTKSTAGSGQSGQRGFQQ